MDQDKYSLTWKTYSEHLKKMLSGMLHSDEYADVTLVCEDKKQLRAHKNILAACSPLFHELLQLDKGSASIVYLRGVFHSEMESLLNFIYLGETSIEVERTGVFLSTAKCLEIRELCSNIKEDEFESKNISGYKLENVENDDNQACTSKTSISEEDMKLNEKPLGLETVSQEECSPQKTRKYHGRKPYKHNDIIKFGNKFKCVQCGKLYQGPSGRSHAIEHKKAVHGVKYSCDQCTYMSGAKAELQRHIKAVHEGIRLACDQCDRDFSTRAGLRGHINAIHKGIKFSCDQCDYQTVEKRHLTVHIKGLHEGQRLSCKICDFKTLHQANLVRHVKVKHN